MSRPNSSVPNQCSADGGRSRTLRFWASGAYGASRGARAARRASTTTRTRPTTAARLRTKRRTAGDRVRRGDRSREVTADRGACTPSLIAHLGVQDRVRQVDGEVDDDEHDGDE